MPIGRIVLKVISESKKVSQLKSDGARLLYTWLIPHVDVNGCFSGDADVIKGQVFTRLHKATKVVESYLQDIENNDLIIRYKVDGDTFLIIPDFKEKQPSLNPDREGKTRIPLPTPEQLKSKSGVAPTQYKDKLNINIIYSPNFDEIYKDYPNKDSKKEAERHFNASVKTEQDFKDIKKALVNYKKHLKKEDWKKPKSAKTWFNNWRDWVDYKTPGYKTEEDVEAERIERIRAKIKYCENAGMDTQETKDALQAEKLVLSEHEADELLGRT